MLRIVLGNRGERESAPAVLYIGHNADDAQAAIDAAPAIFERIETGELPHLRRARKNRNAVPAPLEEILAPSEAIKTFKAQALENFNLACELGAELEKERSDREEERRGIQKEFARQIEVAAARIRELEAALQAAAPASETLSTALATPPPEQPPEGELVPPSGALPEDTAGPALDLGTEPTAPAPPTGRVYKLRR